MLRLLLFQLPHVSVIFFPEPCVTVLDTSSVNIIIVPLTIYSPTIWFHAVTFLTIALTRFSVEGGWYQSIIVTARCVVHSDDRFSLKTIDRAGQEQKDCCCSRE